MLDFKYREYAEAIITNTIPSGRYIKLQCQRYLDLQNDDRYWFDTKECDKVVAFCESIKLFTDKWADKKVVLMPWQKHFIYSIYGWKLKGTNIRKHKNVLLFIARKSAKTATAALLLLYEMCSSKGSQVLMVANSAKQSRIAFEMCSNFARSLDPKGKLFHRYRDSVSLPKIDGKLQMLASDSASMDGYSPQCFLCDEVHEYNDDKIYSTLKNGQGARDNGIGIMVTTSGYNKKFLYEYYQNCIDVLEGLKEDETLLPMLYTLDEGDDWKDPSVWIKANPSLGVTVSEAFLKEQVQAAINNPQLEVSTKTKNFNVWCDVAEVWLQEECIKKVMKPINLDDWKDKEITLYCGVDLASVSDLTALSLMWEYEGKFYFKNIPYLPSETVKTSANGEHYKKWIKNKQLVVMSHSNVTDYDVIFGDLMKLYQEFPIEKISYDQWNSASFIQDCVEQGLPVVPYSQSIGNMSIPTKELQRLILSGNIVIDASDATLFCFRNSVIKADWNENQKVVKTSNDNKIDIVVAMINALGGYLKDHYVQADFTAL